jgi:chromosome segregation ATPase
MSKIVLSSGIRGIDWQGCLNAFAKASNSIVHYDNVLLNSKGKFDDLLLQTEIADNELTTCKKQVKQYLAKLTKNKKYLVNCYSDPAFIEGSDAWCKVNADKTFLFFYSSPEYYLAKSKLKKQDALDTWLEDSNKIWDFYTRFPDNTSVINIEDVENQLAASLTSILESLRIKRFSFSKSAAKNAVALGNDYEQLSFLLTKNLYITDLNDAAVSELYENFELVSILGKDNLHCQQTERISSSLLKCKELCSKVEKASNKQSSEFLNSKMQVSRLEQELESVGKNSQYKNEQNLALEAKVTSLEFEKESMNEQLLELAVKESAYSVQCTELQSDNEIYSLKINQQKCELEAIYADAKRVNEDYSKLETLTFQQKAEISKLASEREMLLEEIKQSEKERQKVNTHSNELVKRNAKLETIRADLIMQKQSFLVKISQLQKELSESDLKVKELFAENENLQKGNQEVISQTQYSSSQFEIIQEQLESAVLSNNEITARNVQLENEVEELSVSLDFSKLQFNQVQEELNVVKVYFTDFDELSSRLKATQAQCDEFETIIAQSKRKQNDLTIENELSTIQISQLQEELEYNFSQYQKMSYAPNSASVYQNDPKQFREALKLMSLN